MILGWMICFFKSLYNKVTYFLQSIIIQVVIVRFNMQPPPFLFLAKITSFIFSLIYQLLEGVLSKI